MLDDLNNLIKLLRLRELRYISEIEFINAVLKLFGR